MVNVQSRGIILEKTTEKFETEGVFNPACIRTEDGVTHMFYRAVAKGNRSTIGYCQLIDGKVANRAKKPFLVPEHDFEKHGLEDPRILKLDSLYYLFYTAFDGKSARVAYATSANLRNFQKHGVISPEIDYDSAIQIFKKQRLKESYEICKGICEEVGGKNMMLWDKDAFIFPKKIKGKFALIHRIMPDIQIAYFDDFSELDHDYWMSYLSHLRDSIILEQKYPFENRTMGGGCPPIETEEGWLLICHCSGFTESGVIYHATAALLDKENPQKVLGRLDVPLFSPEVAWENLGNVNDVVFPTGAVLVGDELTIYYGAADERVGAKSLSIKELLRELKK
ncbi:MAG: pesticidal protein Cry7Aa [Parcubacteria group bacterium GW2011_GWA2_51_12]|nr:MAG: pesticidal protein Cry7Aa [Parcubacteria group bacterium GW2011_GWA2_51_12]